MYGACGNGNVLTRGASRPLWVDVLQTPAGLSHVTRRGVKIWTGGVGMPAHIPMRELKILG